MEPRRSEFSAPRAFHPWSRNCRNPSGLLANYFFVCVSLIGNPAVFVRALARDQICTDKIVSLGIAKTSNKR